MQGVVLLHGILKSSKCMKSFEKAFLECNYKVLNIDYPSTKLDILSIVDFIKPQIIEFSNSVDRLHFVGHSLGGLIIRTLLNQYNFTNLGRVVLIGTPNKGTKLADFFKNFWLYKKLFGPAGQQLTTNQKDIKTSLGNIKYEMGIIAGLFKYNFFTNLIIKSPSDGLVSIESTKTDGTKQHIIIPSEHLKLTKNKRVIEHTIKFIETGSF